MKAARATLAAEVLRAALAVVEEQLHAGQRPALPETRRAGRLQFLGKPLPYAGRANADGLPATFRNLGIGHVPEDRLRDGVIKDFSVMHNTVFGYQDHVKNRWGLFDFKRIAQRCGIRFDHQQVRYAGAMLGRTGPHLRGGREMQEAVARIVGAAGIGAGGLGFAPVGRANQRVDEGFHGAPCSAPAPRQARSSAR